jgi:hypothetical protein
MDGTSFLAWNNGRSYTRFRLIFEGSSIRLLLLNRMSRKRSSDLSSGDGRVRTVLFLV